MVGGRVGHFSQTLATLDGVSNTPSNSAFSSFQTDAAPGLGSSNAAFRAQAMLLAAGRGERMRPLTDLTPKPLLKVGSKPLLWYPLQALAKAGVHAAVINTGWLGDQIEPAFGTLFSSSPTPNADASNAVQLHYSHEGRGAGEALETAGGIVRALPLLDEVFWVAAGDIFAPDFAFSPKACEHFQASPQLAHIWLVPNPAHNARGDFGLSAAGLALNLPKPQAGGVSSAPQGASVQQSGVPNPALSPPLFTFSTIALYKRAFFEADWCPIPPGNPAGVKAPLAPMLRAAMDQGLVSASLYEGLWVDVGTPERLAQLNP